MTLNKSELATILAALRIFQKDVAASTWNMHSHFAECDALTTAEIDALCERINGDATGYVVRPDITGPLVIFEWLGEGATPKEQAQDAWDNMRNCAESPMVTVLAPDGTTVEVDLDEVDDDYAENG